MPRCGVKGTSSQRTWVWFLVSCCPWSILGWEQCPRKVSVTAQEEPTLSKWLLLMLEWGSDIFSPPRRGWKSKVYHGREEAAFLNMP